MLQVLSLHFSHLILNVHHLLLRTNRLRCKRLFSGILNVNSFIWSIFRPVVVILIIKEVKDIEDMSEVDETVSTTSLLDLLLIHGQPQIIKPELMVHLKVISNFSISISTRNILHHQVSSCLFILYNLLNNNRTSIFLADVWNETLLWVLLLHLVVVVQSPSFLLRVRLFITANINMAVDCSQE